MAEKMLEMPERQEEQQEEQKIVGRKTFEILCSGEVQGVGFRNYCTGIARKVNIQGKIANLRDGTVKILANLNEKELAYFRNQIKIFDNGHIFSIKVKETEAQTFQGFTVGS